MSGIGNNHEDDFDLEDLAELSTQQQADRFVTMYATTRNRFESVSENNFPDFNFDQARQNYDEILTTPAKIKNTISVMNKRAACIEGDVPFKIFSLFSDQLSKPICNIINSVFIDSVYPEMWKVEYITPIPKIYPPENLKSFRPLSGLLNCAKIADRIMASYILEDMTCDKMQYGNEKGLSINHYLIKMIHKFC